MLRKTAAEKNRKPVHDQITILRNCDQFQNNALKCRGVLRRIFEPKRDEATGEGRKPHNEQLHDLYPSPNIVRVIKSRMRWAGHVAQMGRGEACTGYWWGNLKERDHWRDPGVDGRIILTLSVPN
jgi:hypothetical protein